MKQQQQQHVLLCFLCVFFGKSLSAFNPDTCMLILLLLNLFYSCKQKTTTTTTTTTALTQQ
jgi:hypothetical protein